MYYTVKPRHKFLLRCFQVHKINHTFSQQVFPQWNLSKANHRDHYCMSTVGRWLYLGGFWNIFILRLFKAAPNVLHVTQKYAKVLP